jgi:hypothetical protein
MFINQKHGARMGRGEVQGRRLLEWYLALHAMLLGLVVVLPGESMGGPAYAVLTSYAPEWAFGALFGLAGLAHGVALWVNGAQARATTAARAAVTAVSVAAWASFALGFWLAAPWSTAVPAYAGLSLAALAAFYRALRDAFRVRRPDDLLAWAVMV